MADTGRTGAHLLTGLFGFVHFGEMDRHETWYASETLGSSERDEGEIQVSRLGMFLILHIVAYRLEMTFTALTD